ncbi:S-adenosyl-L-methionine-dependent methyltransferase [Podospora appendiculata]|uniref:S-adenosyl-L-methionine-dependent methyltransferase n=1 Tax=Podospora appendiculata TaxID=314037 RepID=A0AAE0XJZ8_9PEZI|nr:S-adenosyl-L-methionine-dependent methyltransferase [Podospora appendiculata]
MDIMHKFHLVARRDVLHSAPLHNQQTPHILDLGCGTGIWTIDMADKYPNGHLIGLDLALIQPEYIPANLRFEQMDIEDPWHDMGLGTWDLIHMRSLNGSIANWGRLYSEIYRHLKPHYGFVEQVEIDWTPRCVDQSLSPSSYVMQWADELLSAMDRFGRSMRVDSGLTKQRMRHAGFTDIKEEVIRVPFNGWPTDEHGRDTGRWFNLGLTQGMHALTIAPLFRGHGKMPEEVTALVKNVVEEIRSRKMHAYCTLHVYTARRP